VPQVPYKENEFILVWQSLRPCGIIVLFSSLLDNINDLMLSSYIDP
jgi:hypothetical protein